MGRRASQVKADRKKKQEVLKSPTHHLSHHVLEQPLVRPRVPVTSKTLKGGTLTPENRVIHAIATLTAPVSNILSAQQDTESRCFAATEIGNAGVIWRGKERDALGVLFKTMQHPDSRVSMAAGQAVAEIAPRGDQEVFRETRALLSHELEHVRLSALRALTGSAALADEAAVEATTGMFTDGSLRVRRRAVVALPSLAPAGHPMLLRCIGLHINHNEAYVRAAACRAVGKVADALDETALGLLRQTLSSDADMSVRIEALDAILPLTVFLRDHVIAQKETTDPEASSKGSGAGKAEGNVLKGESGKEKEEKIALAKTISALNISAVMLAMQDSVGSANAVFVKRASTSLRYMMGSSDKGADMVQEPHRQEEGYIGTDPPPHMALRLGLHTPGGMHHAGELLSPMGELEGEDWDDDDWDDDELGAFVILDGKVMMRSQLTPRRLARALPSPAPSSRSSRGSPLPRMMRQTSRRHSSSSGLDSPGLESPKPFARKTRKDSGSHEARRRAEEEEMAAGVSEFDILDRSGVPLPADRYAVTYGTGTVANSTGLFAELPIDVRQGVGPIRLGVVGRQSAVDVLLFWRRGRIWTLDVSDCVVRPSATAGSAGAIWKIEENSFVSCSNVQTQHIFPHLNDSTFRFAAGPLERSGRPVILFVYTDYALEVPLEHDAASGSLQVDASEAACKLTLAQALGADFATALVPPTHAQPQGPNTPQVAAVDSTDSCRTLPGAGSNKARDDDAPYKDKDRPPSARERPVTAQSRDTDPENLQEDDQGFARQPSVSVNMSILWTKVGYCATGEVPYKTKTGRVWHLFQYSYVSVFECCGEAENESSRLLHPPRSIDKVIHGGPPAVSACVGPLETVAFLEQGQWKRSKVIFLFHADCVWEWNVNSGQTLRTVRQTQLSLDIISSTSTLPPAAASPGSQQAEASAPVMTPQDTNTTPAKTDKTPAKTDNPPPCTDSSERWEKPLSRSPSSENTNINRTDSSVNRSPSSKQDSLPVQQHSSEGSGAAALRHFLASMAALGLSEVTGMPMLRRERRGAAWIERCGVKAPPLHLSVDGIIPSHMDLMGHYVLVDELWADTDRPLYMYLTAKRNAGGMGGSLRLASTLTRAPSRGITRVPSGGMQGVAADLDRLSRQPSVESQGIASQGITSQGTSSSSSLGGQGMPCLLHRTPSLAGQLQVHNTISRRINTLTDTQKCTLFLRCF